MNAHIKNASFRFAETLVGRKNMVRLARFLTNHARLDLSNEMSNNGELIAQTVALRHAAVLHQRSHIFDVGANVGFWTKCLLELNRDIGADVLVDLFEPVGSTYDVLAANLDRWYLRECTRPNRLALSSRSGRSHIHIVGAGEGRNSLHPVPEGDALALADVDLSTVDEYCDRCGIPEITLLKIDAEGHDLEVIRGATEMIGRGKIEILQFEYNARWIESRSYLRDVFDLLTPVGYIIGKLTPRGVEFYSRWDFELETYREGNYVAVRPKLLPAFPVIKWWNHP